MKFWLSLVLFIFSSPLLLNAQNDIKAAKKRIDDIRDAMNKDFGSDWDDDDFEMYAPGEKVQVYQGGGNTIEAEVVEQGKRGWVEVKYKMNGREVTSSYHPDWLGRRGQDPKLKRDDDAFFGRKGKTKTSTKIKSAKADAAPEEARPRVWADKSGKFQIKAKFLEVKEGKVRLEKENGKTISIELTELADVDRKLAEKLSGVKAPQPAAEENGGEAVAPAGPKLVDALAIEPRDALWLQTKSIKPSGSGAWKYQPDGPPDVAKPLTPRPARLYSSVNSKEDSNSNFFNHVESMFFARDRGLVCVVSRDGHPGLEENPTVLQRVELDKAKLLETIEVSEEMKPLAIDPVGRRILLSGGGWPSELTPRLAVWEFGNGTLQHVATWNPIRPDETNKRLPKTGFLIDANSAISVTDFGELVMWDVNSTEPVYSVALARNAQPALSPGRKHLAVATEEGIFLLDAMTGETVASLLEESANYSVLEFSLDGKRLAGIVNHNLVVWNLENGEKYREIPLPSSYPGTIDWISEKHIIVQGELLVDIEKRIVPWEYQKAEFGNYGRIFGEMGGVFWYVLTSDDRKERGVFGAVIPHDEAKAVTASVNADDLLVLKKGTQVSVAESLQGTDEEKQKALAALTKNLKAMGLEVVENAKLTFLAKTEQGPLEQVTYSPWGARNDESKHQKVSVTHFRNALYLKEGETVLWEDARNSGGAWMITARQGESLQQAIAPYQRADLSFYDVVKIPRDIVRNDQAAPRGASKLTHRGIEPSDFGPRSVNRNAPAVPQVPPQQPNNEPKRSPAPKKSRFNFPKVNLVDERAAEPENNAQQAEPEIEQPPRPQPKVEPVRNNDRPIRKRR